MGRSTTLAGAVELFDLDCPLVGIFIKLSVSLVVCLALLESFTTKLTCIWLLFENPDDGVLFANVKGSHSLW